MEYLISAIVSWLAAVILNEYMQKIFLIIFGIFFPAKFNITGKWRAIYCEYNRKRQKVEIEEIIQIRQIGRLIMGRCINSGNMSPVFLFRGRVLNDCILGDFYISKCKNAQGAGAFQLQYIDGILTGKCIWYDRDHNYIEGSDYYWERDDRLD